jgi:hypothetical protein
MSAVKDLWRQLVQRRLWPVALLLLAAMAVVPLTLAHHPEPVEVTPTPAATGDDVLATQPIVALAGEGDRARRRHVLGTRKNPFAVPDPLVAPTDTSAPSAVTSTPTSTSAGTSTPSSSGGVAPTGTGSPSPTSTDAPADPVQGTYAMHEPTVRFGAVSGDPVRGTLRRLQPLPSPEAPVLINLGVLKDGKTAVFVLGRGVTASGEATCEPSPESCYTIRLKAGQTEIVVVTDDVGAEIARFRIELIKIRERTTTTSALANDRSKVGLRLLRARVVTGGPTGYRWNPEVGALERRSMRSLSGTLAERSVSALR